MKLTLISTLLLAASTMVSAAPHLQQRAPASCKVVSGVCGKNNGNGGTGACCISDNDCNDTCNSSGCGVSDGSKPQTTCPTGSSTTITITTTTATSTSTSTPSTCKVVSGVCGKKNGNGGTGACCSSDADCKDTCNKSGCGVSDGTKPQSTCPKGPTTTLTSTTTKTTSTTTTATSTPSTCNAASGSCGKKKGNGDTGACCTSDDDCKDTCNKSGCGVSDGTKPQSTCPKGPTTTLTSTTTKTTSTTSTATSTPANCKVVSDVCGKKNGNGATGACCSSDDDCKDTCNSSGCGVSDGSKPQSTCPAMQTIL